MRRFVTVFLASLLALALAVPAASAAPNDTANRAYLIGQLGDAFVELSGLTEAEINAILADADDPGWSDDSGDFDGDGTIDARDKRVRAYAWIAHEAGIMIGTTATTFDPHDPTDRDAAASVFKRVFFGPGNQHRETLYSDVGAINVHSCNIHLISDIDEDGLYGDNPYIIQGFPPVPSVYKPNQDVSEGQVDSMVARSVEHATTAADPFDNRYCKRPTYRGPIELDKRLEKTADTPASR